MERKPISITVCDDFMNMDIFEESKIIHKRKCLYFVSLFITTLCLMGIFYWTWIVLRDID